MLLEYDFYYDLAAILKIAAILKMQVTNGLFFEERRIMSISAKFHSCITKCMILLKKKME